MACQCEGTWLMTVQSISDLLIRLHTLMLAEIKTVSLWRIYSLLLSQLPMKTDGVGLTHYLVGFVERLESVVPQRCT